MFKKKIRVIAAMDILNGNCVRLRQGKFETAKIYPGSPLKNAIEFDQAGIRDLHIVDLNGAGGERLKNHKIIKEICRKTKMSVYVGGGINTMSRIQDYIDSGVSGVTVTGMVLKNRKEFEKCLFKFGPDKLRIAADVKEGRIAFNGWRKISEWDIHSFVGYLSRAGVTTFICTDTAKDGMMRGSSTDLYADILIKNPEIKLIASGGVTGFEEIKKLAGLGVWGVIVGKSIYEGKISAEDIVAFQNGEALC